MRFGDFSVQCLGNAQAWLLWASLAAFALGSTPAYRTGAVLSAGLTLACLVLMLRQGRPIPWRTLALLCALPGGFVLVHWLGGHLRQSGHEFSRFAYALAFALAAALLPQTLGPTWRERLWSRLVALAALVIGVQFIAALWQAPQGVHGVRVGVMHNPHHLALFMLACLPLLLHRALTGGGRQRAVCITLAVMASWLLLVSQSRPAWLAVLLTGIVLLARVGARARAWLAAALLLLPALIYQAGPALVRERVDDLFAHIGTEERVSIWADSWRMQQASSGVEWAFGHGLGAFAEPFKSYSHVHAFGEFVFPHNFVLEVLYSSGLVGLLGMLAAYAALGGALWRRCAMGEPAGARGAALLLLALFLLVSLFNFLVLPFVSHYNLAFLALIAAAPGGLDALRNRHPTGLAS